MSLRDIVHKKDISYVNEKKEQTIKFINWVFKARELSARPIVDDVNICEDTLSVLKIIQFEKSLKKIASQISKEEELKNRDSIDGIYKKEITITKEDKKYLNIYLFERGLLEQALLNEEAVPYISWGLWSQMTSNASYSIYDESNAGAAVLRKLICIDNNQEYPGTIIIPDPIKINGEKMRYQIQNRDLVAYDALLISNTFQDIHNKLCGKVLDSQSKDVGASPKFLDFLASILISFGPQEIRREVNHTYSKKRKSAQNSDNFSELQNFICRNYWRFIEPFSDSIEKIGGLNQSLFIPEKSVEEALNLLGSKRNREILREIISYKNAGATCNEIANGLIDKKFLSGKKAAKGLYRDLNKLRIAGLVYRTNEGALNKYFLYNNKTSIRISWDPLECKRNLDRI